MMLAKGLSHISFIMLRYIYSFYSWFSSQLLS
jgi:hypothetical protein